MAREDETVVAEGAGDTNFRSVSESTTSEVCTSTAATEVSGSDSKDSAPRDFPASVSAEGPAFLREFSIYCGSGDVKARRSRTFDVPKWDIEWTTELISDYSAGLLAEFKTPEEKAAEEKAAKKHQKQVSRELRRNGIQGKARRAAHEQLKAIELSEGIEEITFNKKK